MAIQLAPAGSRAENPGVNVQMFRPSSHIGDLFNVQSADTRGHLRWNVGVWANYGKNPLGFVDESGTFPKHEAIQNMTTLELAASMRLFDRLSVALAIPFHAAISGQDSGFITLDPIPSSAMGDLRLDARVGLMVRDRGDDGFGVALSAKLGLPTGNVNAFVSDGLTFTPAALVDLRLGAVLIAINLGYKLRSDESLAFGTTVGNEFVWGGGVSVDVLPEAFTLIGEIVGGSANYSAKNSTRVEGLLGLRWTIAGSGVALNVGGGTAFSEGYGSVKYRIFGGLFYAPPENRDSDGDGIMDDDDACPNDPEDFDGFEDVDGCPEADNDKDSVPDTVDKCPLEREDFDGFEDEDGCPDPDNDGDGVLDKDDKCPLDAEDKDGFEDEDGCPEADNDGDGILDADDNCPDEPEDRDGYQDDDGCPDPDNDGDGILDIDDDCPSDAENTCGVQINPCEIVIGDKVYFEYGSDVIKGKSHALLEAVASVIMTREWITKVEVEGHTDNQGTAAYNLQLSQMRAEAVRAFLIAQGIAGERLIATGHGESRPIAHNRTHTSRTKNRRVQFIIVEPSQTGCGFDAKPK